MTARRIAIATSLLTALAAGAAAHAQRLPREAEAIAPVQRLAATRPPARAEDPFAKVYLVTSRALYEGGIDTQAAKLADRRDGIGNELVIAETRAWQLPEISHGIHERERHCGGFFAFATRAEAEAFLRNDRSAKALQAKALADYGIDNAATEQVFGHLKDAFHAGREFASYEQFKNELDAYIIHWNTKRRQIRLERHTPEEFRNMSPTA